MLDFSVDDLDVDEETDGFTILGEDGEPVIDEPEPERMTKDEFWNAFQMAFAAPAIFIPDLEAIAIQPEEVREARRASDATYRLLERYFPAALDEKTGPIFDMLTVGAFMFGKVMMVKVIMAAKRARDVTPPEPEHQPEEQPQKPADPIGGSWHAEPEPEQ